MTCSSSPLLKVSNPRFHCPFIHACKFLWRAHTRHLYSRHQCTKANRTSMLTTLLETSFSWGKQTNRQLYKLLINHSVCYEGDMERKKGGQWSGPHWRSTKGPCGGFCVSAPQLLCTCVIRTNSCNFVPRTTLGTLELFAYVHRELLITPLSPGLSQ